MQELEEGLKGSDFERKIEENKQMTKVHLEIPKYKIEQGGRSWLAFGERKIIPQSFRRARICKFSRQKRRFLQLRKYW